jgi:hypothetical protein
MRKEMTMIERVALRVGDTARRTSRAVEELVPGMAPRRRRPPLVTATRVAIGAAAAAVGFVSSPSTRREVADRAKELSGHLLPDRGRSNRRGTGDASARKGAGKAATATRRAASGVANLTKKTKEELYQLAQEASVEGRSSMTTEELAGAVAKAKRGA